MCVSVCDVCTHVYVLSIQSGVVMYHIYREIETSISIVYICAYISSYVIYNIVYTVYIMYNVLYIVYKLFIYVHI